ncbi:MAG TPA: PAS domain-containing protein, partial [Caulobacteraceae bacterium]|nr:PAS domain-containing protein [Caulobacteraceae bacterium]
LSIADPINLWTPAYRAPLQLALEAVLRQPGPLVIAAEARVRGDQTLKLEITLAPLAGPNGEIDRLIGLYQPVTPVAILDGQVIETLAIRNITSAGLAGAAFPRLKLAAMNGRQIA